jgi:linoleoyl-CoA desaturase
MTTRFLPQGAFFTELKQRVDAHLAAAPDRRWVVVAKSALIASWWAGSWVALVFFAQTWWQAGLAAVSLGLAMAGIGFNTQHDGGHHAVSTGRAGNRAMAFALDLLGGSSWVWHWKHNVQHHTTPNLVGLDADIDIQPFVRLSPSQAWRPWHRFQHLYVWFLYALLAIKWHFIDDFKDVITGRIGEQSFPRPRGLELVGFIAGKALFLTWALVIPSLFHPLHHVLLGYLLVSVVVSLCLAITFQAAHCVELAEFPDASSAKTDWAEHQVRTSVDFGSGTSWWSQLIGGLDLQTVHHLFPRVAHVQLAELAPIVAEVSEKHGLRYHVLPGMGAAVASHARWLRKLGAGP